MKQRLGRPLWLAILLSSLLGTLAAGCSTGVATPSPATAVPETPAATEAPLTGTITRADLEAYAGWADLWTGDYVPDESAIAQLRDDWGDAEVLVFLGTWCGDSKREVPHFFQIMDAAGIDQAQVTIIGLDRTKKDAAGLTDTWQVEYVPTFIVTRDGAEIGRIVERPANSLEADLAAILSAGS